MWDGIQTVEAMKSPQFHGVLKEEHKMNCIGNPNFSEQLHYVLLLSNKTMNFNTIFQHVGTNYINKKMREKFKYVETI